MLLVVTMILTGLKAVPILFVKYSAQKLSPLSKADISLQLLVQVPICG